MAHFGESFFLAIVNKGKNSGKNSELLMEKISIF